MDTENPRPTALLISPDDNVAVVLKDFEAGEWVVAGHRRVACLQAVPSGHKVALDLVQLGGRIVKCGVPVGLARRAIDAGEHVHIHNVASRYITDH
jgi:hypothetical protein